MVRFAVLLSLGAMGCTGEITRDGDGARVFDARVLHTVSIEVDPQYLGPLDADPETRVPCTLTYDGRVLEDVGIRKKGGYGSVSPLDGKTGFSIKLDERVEGQRLDGLQRLLLNNARQDPSFLGEHLGYQGYRVAGLAAPRTAHATVSFNGEDFGLYVVKEPIADDFLDRVFGGDDDQGNLYEGSLHTDDAILGDFVLHPEQLELKDELEEGRSRDDVNELAAVIREASDAEFESEVRARFDLDGYITSVALDAVLGHWDSYTYNYNNYYLYNVPSTGRFVYLPHGMDQLEYRQHGEPISFLPTRLLQIPELADAIEAEVERIRVTWPADAMAARIDQVEAILVEVPPGGRSERDAASFRGEVDAVRAAVAAIAASP